MSRNHMINPSCDVSVSRAAQILECHASTVRRWESEGYLQSYRTMGEQRRFNLKEIYRAKRMGILKFFYSSSQLQGPRDYQQDHALLMPEYGAFAICDGMGGMERGELASETAVRFFQQRIPLVLWPDLSTLREMHNMILDANQAVRSILPKGTRGGTTATLAVFFRHHIVCIGHVGDSRLYRVRNGVCELLSIDHAGSDGSLLSGLGIYQDPPVIQANLRSWQRGDVFLFCSDGFSNAIKDCVSKRNAAQDVERITCEMIARLVTEGMSAQMMNEHVEKSCTLHDNSTVIRVDVR